MRRALLQEESQGGLAQAWADEATGPPLAPAQGGTEPQKGHPLKSPSRLLSTCVSLAAPGTWGWGPNTTHEKQDTNPTVHGRVPAG